MRYRDKEDGKIRWKVHDVTHKGAGEEGKYAATVDGCNAACCRKRFVEGGLGFGIYLLGVEFVAEDSWLVGDPVAVNRRRHKNQILRGVQEVGPFRLFFLAIVVAFVNGQLKELRLFLDDQRKLMGKA